MEGEGWLIQMRGTDEYEYSPQGITLLSLLRTIIQNHLIPKKEEVIEQIHAVIDVDGYGKDWGDAWEGGVFRKTFQNFMELFTQKSYFQSSCVIFIYLLQVSEKIHFHSII